MPTKLFPKLVVTGLVLAYPVLTHWARPYWPNFPHILLTMMPTLLNAWLAWIFGHTLLPGREPLIGMFARMERHHLLKRETADLPADVAHYTRILTYIWSALFIVMASVSTILALSGRLMWWTVFTGGISYLLVGALFVGEYWYRRRRFTQERHANPFQLAWILIKSGPIWMRRTR
jgi:uncharacterized membrane protein